MNSAAREPRVRCAVTEFAQQKESVTAYSMMVWLVDPGEHPQQEDETARAAAIR
jgi:hypothetical protein